MQNAEHPIAPNGDDQPQSRWKKWMVRFGFWGFMFFLIKGLLWLIIPALIAYGVISW